MFPRSVSVRGALDVRSAHTRPTGMCLAYWSVSRGPKAYEFRLLQVLLISRSGEFKRRREVKRGPLPRRRQEVWRLQLQQQLHDYNSSNISNRDQVTEGMFFDHRGCFSNANKAPVAPVLPQTNLYMPATCFFWIASELCTFGAIGKFSPWESQRCSRRLTPASRMR